MTGTIKRLKDKGFGFIGPDDGGSDLFFHAKGLHGVKFEDLREGDRVEFTLGEGPKGPQAQNVERVG